MQKREQGFPVTGQIIRMIALNAPNNIKKANFKASKCWLKGLLKRLGISMRKNTHRIQEFVNSLLPEIFSYLSVLEAYQDSSEEIIFINFDEVPFYFDMLSDYTYDLKGTKNVEVLSHKNNKLRMTFMPCICSNGMVLPPLYVFIYNYATKSQRIYPKKYEHLANLTRPHIVRFNGSGFTKENLIIEYIEKVILPFQNRIGKKICLLLRVYHKFLFLSYSVGKGLVI